MNFLSNFQMVSQQVLILMIMVVTGLLLQKTKVIDKTGITQMTNILFYIITPCVIIDSFVKTDFNKNTAKEFGVSAVAALLFHVSAILFSFLFFKKENDDRRGILRYAIIFSNCGYFSIPLAGGILGEKGVFLVSIFVVVFNVASWTFGVTLFNAKMSFKKAFLNPGVIGIIVGLPFFFFKGTMIPEVITKPINLFGTLNAPVAMIITGYYLGISHLQFNKGDINIICTVVLRLVAIPAAFLLIYHFLLGFSGDLLLTCMIPVCAPSALNVVMFASKFKKDAVFATRIASVCTIASLITIPVFFSIAKLF